LRFTPLTLLVRALLLLLLLQLLLL